RILTTGGTMRTVRRGLAVISLVSLGAAGLGACDGNPAPTPPPSATPTLNTSVPSTTPQPSARTPTALDGTSFYFENDSSAHVVQVWSLNHGVATRRYAIPQASTDFCVTNSVIVSPNGQRLAWVTGTGEGGGIAGTLSVADLDGHSLRTLNGVICAF